MTSSVDSSAADQSLEARGGRSEHGRSTVVRLLGYMMGGEQRPQAILAIIARIVAIIALTTIPWITGRALDVIGSPSGTNDRLAGWIIRGTIAGVTYLVFSFVSDWMFSRMATKALYKLQTRVFSNIQRLSMGFFYKNPVGELTSRVTNDSEVVALFYEQGVGPLIRASLQVLIILIVMLLINVPLTVVALIVVPFMLGSMYVVNRIASPAFAKLQESVGTTSGFQGETIEGHRVIISKNRREWAGQQHEQLAADVYEVGSRAFLASLMQFPLTQTLILFQSVFVLTVGTIMVINEQTTLGVVMAFTGFASLMASPLGQMSNLVSNALNAFAGGKRVFAIIDEEPTVEDAPDAVEYEFKGGRIECIDVDFSYAPGSKVLRGNTFVVEAGDSVGICGPTGAGKSTLINILTRYYDIDGGTILIDGQDLATLTQRSLRQQIGVVLQEAFLFTDTVMNNLKYARAGATDEDAIAAAKKANAHDFIMELPDGYDTVLAERGANLSQGQRQMITIARAMVAEPKIMILDEATSNVDTRTEKLIQDGMRKLMDDKTSFSIAHRLATIRDSDDIMVLNGGEIVEYAPHTELMEARGFYYALYMSQFKGKAPGGAEATDVDFVST
ncbi:MAG: ABC transporter ATP-binding protein [Actinomycetota bacterium]|nr:ABC transporter ATP-binding protein [Actinomycetota bacterium]